MSLRDELIDDRIYVRYEVSIVTRFFPRRDEMIRDILTVIDGLDDVELVHLHERCTMSDIISIEDDIIEDDCNRP